MPILKGDRTYHSYIQILSEELVFAMGCTEPIDIAYCAAVTRDHLGCIPHSESIEFNGKIAMAVDALIPG